MAPGLHFVVDSLGATALEEADPDDLEEPDTLSVLDPVKSRSVFLKVLLAMLTYLGTCIIAATRFLVTSTATSMKKPSLTA